MARPSRGILSAYAYLAGAGFVSALITVFVVPQTGDFYDIDGWVYGACLSAYFALIQRERATVKLLLFTASCSASIQAAALAVFCTIWSGLERVELSFQSVPSVGMIVGGTIGAFVLLLSAALLFKPDVISSRRLCEAAGLSIVGGGGLALIGAYANVVARPAPTSNWPLLFLIWQPGFAVIVGFFLRNRANSPMINLAGQDATVERVSQALAVFRLLFFACILVGLSVSIVLTIQSKYLFRQIVSH